MFIVVSFRLPAGRAWMPRMTFGGSCENMLKKLIGATKMHIIR
jgi:hypothetical protein